MSKILTAIFGTPNKPLKINEFEIQCYVLENGERVLVQRGLTKALGMSTGGGTGGSQRIVQFIKSQSIIPFIPEELRMRIENPIKFKLPSGVLAHGYEATILVDICDAIIESKNKGLLLKQQEHIAQRAEILIRGFAKTGIIALVDEATGYQEIRDKLALQKILEKYLLKDYAKWAKRFPDEFYEEMFRLKGWQWRGMSVNRPSVVGRYTNDMIYERLAPGVLSELRHLNPKDEKGNRKAKHQQYFTPETGVPALDRHLHSVIALMRASANWSQFERMMARSFPKLGQTIPMNFPDED